MKTRYLFPHYMKKVGLIIFIPSFIVGILILFTNVLENKTIESIFTFKVIALFGGETPIFLNRGTPICGFISIIKTSVLNSLITILLIISMIMIGFSKEKDEDEYIAKNRLESLMWSVYINYSILILATLFIWSFAYLDVMAINMFTILLIFIARFNYILYKNKKKSKNEK